MGEEEWPGFSKPVQASPVLVEIQLIVAKDALVLVILIVFACTAEKARLQCVLLSQ